VKTSRITPYAAGWLTFLVDSGLASVEAAREAQRRVAVEAVRELERRRKKAKKKKDAE
jgi:hypothetical protein